MVSQSAMSATVTALSSGEALAAFDAYLDAFEKLEPESMRNFYHEPSMVISPLGVTSFATGDEVETFFKRQMHDLKKRGYHRTDFTRIGTRPLGPELCLIRGVAKWYKTGGSLLQSFGAIYAFQKTGAHSWKIAVAIFHDSATA